MNSPPRVGPVTDSSRYERSFTAELVFSFPGIFSFIPTKIESFSVSLFTERISEGSMLNSRPIRYRVSPDLTLYTEKFRERSEFSFFRKAFFTVERRSDKDTPSLPAEYTGETTKKTQTIDITAKVRCTIRPVMSKDGHAGLTPHSTVGIISEKRCLIPGYALCFDITAGFSLIYLSAHQTMMLSQ
jgi:hypothetical protein